MVLEDNQRNYLKTKISTKLEKHIYHKIRIERLTFRRI